MRRSYALRRQGIAIVFVAVSVIAAGCAGSASHGSGGSGGTPVAAGPAESTAPAAAQATDTAPAGQAEGAPQGEPSAAATGSAGGSTQAAGGTGTAKAAAGSAPKGGATAGNAAATGGSGGGTASPAPRSAASGSPSGSGTSNSGGSSSAGPAPVPSPAPSGPGTTTGVGKDTVTVGLFYAKTGFYAGLLRNAPAVLQAALDEAGPINGRRVILKSYDDGSYNPSTIQVEEKRAKDEAFGFISLVSESDTILAPLVEQHKVPTVVGNIDRQVALPLHHVFSLLAYWGYQASLLPEFIKNNLGAGDKKIGIVYEGTSTAKDAKDTFKAKAASLGEKIVFEQPIATDQTTCANEVSNLQSHGVEVVYMMNGPLGAICMLRDARALGYKPIFTGVGTSWNFNATATATGGGAEGIRMLTSSTTLETPAGRHFADLMRQKAPNSGADGDDIMLLYYGLAQGFLEGLRRTGPNLTREAFESTFETKMNGYDSGYFPPPKFGPGDRSGVTSVGVTRCCMGGKWVLDEPGWHSGFPTKAPASRPRLGDLRPFALGPRRTAVAAL